MATTEENSCESETSTACEEPTPMETDQEENAGSWSVIIWTDDQLQLIPYPKLKLSEGVTLDRQALFVKMHNFLNGTQPNLKFFIKVWCALILDTPAKFPEERTCQSQSKDENEPSIGEQTFQGKSFWVKLTARVMKLDSMSSNFSEELKFPHASEKDEFNTVTVDDAKFHEWYMNPDNLFEARVYFGLLCINMLRISARAQSSARVHLIARFNKKFDSFSGFVLKCSPPNVCEKFVTKAKKEFERKHKVYRGTLRLLIDFFHQKGCISFLESQILQRSIEQFCAYAITEPFEYTGLHVLKSIQRGCKGYYWSWFHNMMIAHENIILRGQYQIYRTVMIYLRLIHKQDENFISDSPELKGKTVDMFRFSRVLDGEYFSQFAIDNMREFAAFVFGVTKLPLERVERMSALRHFPELEQYYGLGKSTREKKDYEGIEMLENFFAEVFSENSTKAS